MLFATGVATRSVKLKESVVRGMCVKSMLSVGKPQTLDSCAALETVIMVLVKLAPTLTR